MGKFQKPCCMKNMNCPREYKAGQTAWATVKIFCWSLLCLERMACKNGNILLLLDQYAAHNHICLQLKHFPVLYLPLNTTITCRLSIKVSLIRWNVHTRSSWFVIICKKQKRMSPWIISENGMLVKQWTVVVAWNSTSGTFIHNFFIKRALTRWPEQDWGEL